HAGAGAVGQYLRRRGPGRLRSAHAPLPSEAQAPGGRQRGRHARSLAMNAPLESLSGTASGGRKVLTVDDLCVEILSDEGAMLAVKRLGLALRLGQTFALVGESGC